MVGSVIVVDDDDRFRGLAKDSGGLRVPREAKRVVCRMRCSR